MTRRDFEEMKRHEFIPEGSRVCQCFNCNIVYVVQPGEYTFCVICGKEVITDSFH